MTTRKKLIEVALPLEAINKASVREGYIYRGNPSAIHKWWAQRPLAAARAVLFAQLVDDPAGYVDELLSDSAKVIKAQHVLNERLAAWQTRRQAFEQGRDGAADPGPAPTLRECAAELERQRLFALIEQLVLWENTTNEGVLQQARDEIWRSWRRTCAENSDHPRAAELFDPNKLPIFYDPFAGGATIPLEAQRLGLESYASDLNPVAVLINKAIIEIPPKFAGMPPVNPEARKNSMGLGHRWKGAAGLAEDIRYYGQQMRDNVQQRVGHLYPKVEITAAMAQDRPDLKPYVGQKLTVIAWLWARTVKSPNPAYKNIDVPLTTTFMVSTKAGKEVYVEPVINNDSYRFEVKLGRPSEYDKAKNGTKLGGSNFVCMLSGVPISSSYVKSESKSGRIGARLMAMVVEGKRGRIYLSPANEHEDVVKDLQPEWRPDIDFFQKALGFRVGNYGMTRWSDIFTSRQLVSLTSFADQIGHMRELIKQDAVFAGLPDNEKAILQSVGCAQDYADAISTYLAFSIDKTAEYSCTLVPWYSPEDRPKGVFAKQTIPMVWDYAEVNPFCEIGGSFNASAHIVAGSVEGCNTIGAPGIVRQLDAKKLEVDNPAIFSTDPPYYDNVGYADLSDFFYVWLRHSMRPVFPDLFATLVVPKSEELVATPARHGGSENAEKFFLNGMTMAIQHLAAQSHAAFPATIYYAFKQAESNSPEGISSTGWETFLEAVINSGFALNATWPMRTERQSRSRGIGSNALASSIILVCRRRPQDEPTVTRRDFVAALKVELPRALRLLQAGNIAPVDLAQASIGPGMAIFTRYGKVIDASGKPLRVREALALINQTLDEVLAEQEGDFDAETRWAVTWFEQQGFGEGEYGVAETLATARNTSVRGMAEADVLASKGGKVRLLRPEELPANWNPDLDARLTVWEMVHHLVRALDHSEARAAELLAKLGPRADAARELAYRLYAVCERKKRASEALAYNGLVQSWPQMLLLAGEQKGGSTPTQQGLGL